ncbi:putative arginyl-tRNA--protein transferase 1 isoform X4 [Apostichopus japonicus]|uniref:Arginyl-tRNA--protein transferase 1 n=1 Tax=Stichopus japonicus TaxID=307972 RepID=A0A2G8LFV5_STIJA|nr:putative arginyl-tRNA--protein transferase 1 isoform X4 [Apostichopus japonicus]
MARKSGKYVYKPSMDITCCPCYSVKCAALDFQVSKAHKKILNRVTRYLKTGTRRPSKPKEEESMEAAEPGEPSCSWMDDEDDEKKNDKDVAVKEVDPEKVSEASGNTDIEMKEDTEEGEATEKQQGEGGEEPMSNDAADSRPKKKKAGQSTKTCLISQSQTQMGYITHNNLEQSTYGWGGGGEGRDPSKPPPKKAKQLRREKKLAKLAAAKQASGNTDMNEETMEVETKQEPTKPEKPKQAKTKPEKPKAEDISEGSSVELVRSQPRRFEFNSTFDESYALYKKYQMAIHKDKPSQCSVAQFTRFLVESPLQEETKYPFPKYGFGSFHQHYRIDGKLVAVAVLDILPHSVSSVYFYYDPDYHFLSLGKLFCSTRDCIYSRLAQNLEQNGTLLYGLLHS